MERFVWKTIVRFKSLHFGSFAGATFGQLTWIYLNNLVDYDEDYAKVHEKCKPEYDKERCPVCNEAIGGIDPKVSDEIREKYGDEIYVPGEVVTLEANYSEDEIAVRERLEEIILQHNKEEG